MKEAIKLIEEMQDGLRLAQGALLPTNSGNAANSEIKVLIKKAEMFLLKNKIEVSCNSCKHNFLDVFQEPCVSCFDFSHHEIN